MNAIIIIIETADTQLMAPRNQSNNELNKLLQPTYVWQMYRISHMDDTRQKHNEYQTK